MAFYGLTMIPEHKEAWVKALESGEYNQGRGSLFSHLKNRKTKPSYCCLGVQAIIEGLETSYEHPTDDDITTCIIFKVGPITYMKDDVPPTQWFSKFFTFKRDLDLGMTKTSAINCLIQKLSNMNDNDKSFMFIADWIRNNL